jgi:hypothetical protein
MKRGGYNLSSEEYVSEYGDGDLADYMSYDEDDDYLEEYDDEDYIEEDYMSEDDDSQDW